MEKILKLLPNQILLIDKIEKYISKNLVEGKYCIKQDQVYTILVNDEYIVNSSSILEIISQFGATLLFNKNEESTEKKGVLFLVEKFSLKRTIYIDDNLHVKCKLVMEIGDIYIVDCHVYKDNYLVASAQLKYKLCTT